MGGGLMQLVAYGAQDIYLTGNPQITFFKVVYRRHTNFSIEAIQQIFEQSSDNFYSGGKKSVLISRNGDLIHKIWLECKLKCAEGFFDAAEDKTYVNWTNNTGHALIEECSIRIGGQEMDKHSSRWLDIWNELTDHEEADWLGLNKHAAKNAYLKSQRSLPLPSAGGKSLKLYVPLQFWFCRNVGLALPLIALQYHEVELDIKFRELTALINTDYEGTYKQEDSTINVKVFADYIYLDTDERRRFAQVSHEYLIEQIQYKENDKSKTNFRIDFNHPVKEIIWTLPNSRYGLKYSDNSPKIDATIEDGEHRNDYFNYNATDNDNDNYVEYICGQKSYEGFNRGTIKLNGHVRFKDRDASYFRICQPQQAGHKIPTKHIYMYSFALNPEEHQPSGTCNFSRLDNAHLSFNQLNDTNQNQNINVYVVSYNVLRIMSGMGGLAYSN
jgi:hypothetical protein